MPRKLPPSELPGWPRLMNRELAGAYLGVSAGTLATLPITAVRIGSRVLYDKIDLDRYANGLSGQGAGANSDEFWLAKLDEVDDQPLRRSRRP